MYLPGLGGRGVPAWSQGRVYLPGLGGVPAGGVPAWSRGVYLPGRGGEGCTCLVPGEGVPAWSGGCTCWGGTCLVPGGVPAWSGGCTCLVRWGGVPARGYLPGPRGVYLPGLGGVPGLRRDGGVYLPGPGGRVLGQVLHPVNRMTDRCKNITLTKTSFRPVISSYQDFLGSHSQICKI